MSYAVISLKSSVIYFGGWTHDELEDIDKVAEFKNLEWTLLGKLASPRWGHRSIKMKNKIYLVGGHETTYGGVQSLGQKAYETEMINVLALASKSKV